MSKRSFVDEYGDLVENCKKCEYGNTCDLFPGDCWHCYHKKAKSEHIADEDEVPDECPLFMEDGE
jgi:hypothetical protein